MNLPLRVHGRIRQTVVNGWFSSLKLNSRRRLNRFFVRKKSVLNTGWKIVLKTIYQSKDELSELTRTSIKKTSNFKSWRFEVWSFKKQLKIKFYYLATAMLVELPSIVSVWCNSTDVGSNPGCVIGVYNKKKKRIAELRVRSRDEKIASLFNFPLK